MEGEEKNPIGRGSEAAPSYGIFLHISIRVMIKAGRSNEILVGLGYNAKHEGAFGMLTADRRALTADCSLLTGHRKNHVRCR